MMTVVAVAVAVVFVGVLAVVRWYGRLAATYEQVCNPQLEETPGRPL